MQSKIRVAILDDHPMTVEGYLSKLGKDPAIEVTATMGVADLLEPVLQKSEVNVLILDVTVPISSENRNSYPILHVIPTLLDEHPNLNILVVSMRVERALIRGVMDAGANGYILKDDQNANLNFLEIVKLVAEGGGARTNRAGSARSRCSYRLTSALRATTALSSLKPRSNHAVDNEPAKRSMFSSDLSSSNNSSSSDANATLSVTAEFERAPPMAANTSARPGKACKCQKLGPPPRNFP